MLDLLPYKNAILALPEYQQVILPALIDQQAVDAAVVLREILDPPTNNSIYPLKLPEDVTYPSASYQPVASLRESIDGYDILRNDLFVVTLTAKTFPELVTIADDCRTALLGFTNSNDAGSADVTDQATEYSSKPDRYHTLMELTVTHLAQSSQALPAAFIYTIGEKSEPNQLVNTVYQAVMSEFVVLSVINLPAGGVSEIKPVREAMVNAVFNTPNEVGIQTEHISGSVFAVMGGVVIWRDVFKATHTRQS